MIAFPPQVLDFLRTLQLERSKPAWLLVSAEGVVLDRGGHLEDYGFERSGRSFEEELPWLIGLLPYHGDLLELSLVEVDDHTAFQPYLLPQGKDATLVVVLDMSGELQLQRTVQQMTNERSLTRQGAETKRSSFLGEILAELDLVVLERQPNGDFAAWGAGPSWWSPQQASYSTATLKERCPMLELFLEDAEELWAGRTQRAVSETWEQDDGRPLFASAHLVGERRVLAIRSSGPDYEELRRLIQDLHT